MCSDVGTVDPSVLNTALVGDYPIGKFLCVRCDFPANSHIETENPDDSCYTCWIEGVACYPVEFHPDRLFAYFDIAMKSLRICWDESMRLGFEAMRLPPENRPPFYEVEVSFWLLRNEVAANSCSLLPFSFIMLVGLGSTSELCASS